MDQIYPNWGIMGYHADTRFSPGKYSARANIQPSEHQKAALLQNTQRQMPG
jgi:hypothetical protein